MITPFITSLKTDYGAANGMVKITTDTLIGLEIRSYIHLRNGESQRNLFLLTAQYFAGSMNRKDTLDIAGCIQLMDAIIYNNNY
jgi:hypothetical protein